MRVALSDTTKLKRHSATSSTLISSSSKMYKLITCGGRTAACGQINKEEGRDVSLWRKKQTKRRARRRRHKENNVTVLTQRGSGDLRASLRIAARTTGTERSLQPTQTATPPTSVCLAPSACTCSRSSCSQRLCGSH